MKALVWSSSTSNTCCWFRIAPQVQHPFASLTSISGFECSSTGISMMNFEPWSLALRTWISPSSMSTKFLTMVNPNPVPPYSRVVVSSAWQRVQTASLYSHQYQCRVFHANDQAGFIRIEDTFKFEANGDTTLMCNFRALLNKLNIIWFKRTWSVLISMSSTRWLTIENVTDLSLQQRINTV